LFRCHSHWHHLFHRKNGDLSRCLVDRPDKIVIEFSFFQPPERTRFSTPAPTRKTKNLYQGVDLELGHSLNRRTQNWHLSSLVEFLRFVLFLQIGVFFSLLVFGWHPPRVIFSGGVRPALTIS
jgi:hypothetical protein